MKFFTSYFYQIRFFKPYMIPLSTAVWDPKWFHDFKDRDYMFIDSRGVINGLRANQMAPGRDCDGLCQGIDKPGLGCTLNPNTCKFLQVYKKQLDALDAKSYLADLEGLAFKCKEIMGFAEDPIVVFIVYEPPFKACSERVTIQNWVTQNGFLCGELEYPII